MERAPNVSAALARRITQHLDNGVQPSISGRQVKLRDVVLVRANGTEAPAAEEGRRQAAERNMAIDITFWDRNEGTETQGNRVYGYDIAGNRHMITQRRGQQRVVTAQGRRFYQETPQTLWIINIPIISKRTHAGGRVTYFNRREYALTRDMVYDLYEPGSPEYRLAQALWTRDGPDAQAQEQQLMTQWTALFPVGREVLHTEGSETGTAGVTVHVDGPLTFSVQRQGISPAGERTIDTFLDQVVFGEPVTGFDLWQTMNLHEVSRRRNQECGIDVIVASATVRPCFQSGVRNMVTAEEAAQALVTLAKTHFPDSALAQYDKWKKAAVQNHNTTKTAQMYQDLKIEILTKIFSNPTWTRWQRFFANPRRLRRF